MPTYELKQAQLLDKRKAGYEASRRFQLPQGSMVGGHYVPPSGAEALLQGLQMWQGQRDYDSAGKELEALEAQRRSGLAEGLDKYLRTRDGAPGQTMTDQQAADLMLNDQAPTLADPVKADPRRAVIEAMTSQFPELQKIGQMELAAMLKPAAGHDLGVKDLLPYVDPSSIPQLLQQGVGGFKPKAGKADVQDVSIGDGQWQSFEVGADGRVDMQRPIGQPFSKRPTASDISLGGDGSMPKELAKAQPKIFEETRGQAQAAIRQIQTSDRIERLASDPQLVSGALARPELFMQSLGAKLGFVGPEATAKTQALLRDLAQATLANVKSLPGPLSEKELPFLEAASAGQLEFTPQAILRIAQLQKVAAHNTLMDTYRMYEGNAKLPGGDAYRQAYPLPRQGAYQLDPAIYDVDEGNFATLRDLPQAPAKTGKVMTAEEWLRSKKGGQ